MTKLQLPHLHQTFVNKFLSTNISNKFELVSSHARVTSMKSTKQQSVSESVSEFSDNDALDRILNTAQLQWISASKLDSIHPLTHFIWSRIVLEKASVKKKQQQSTSYLLVHGLARPAQYWTRVGLSRITSHQLTLYITAVSAACEVLRIYIVHFLVSRQDRMVL